MIRNKNQFPANSEIYLFDNRHHANFHQTSVNVTEYQKGASNLGGKVFNMFPSNKKWSLINPRNLKCLYKISYMKTSFILWMNIFHSRKVKM